MQTIDTDQDIIDGLAALQRLDPDLTKVIEVAGSVPLRREPAGFAGLAQIIIGQHVSTASASAIHARFLSAFDPVTPQAYLDASEDTLIKIGLTRAKQATLETSAKAILDGSLDLEALNRLGAEEAIAILTRLKGIGTWTAEIYLLYCIGHPDIFAAGDLAIREAYRHAFKLDKRPEEKELRTIAERWSPHRGIASSLFWEYYAKIK